MIRPLLLTTLVAALATALFVGCAEEANNAPEPASSTGSAGGHADPEIEKAIAALSSEDRALAEQQKTCPVTKEPLGSMGTPIKVEVEGRTVFVCCKSCIETLKANPEEYLSNL